MKFYLSASILQHLIDSPGKKKLGTELESLLHDGHRYYTSVYSLLTLMQLKSLQNSDKWRTILHLVGEIVEEILPIDKTILEIACENQTATILSAEAAIAKLSGLDEVIIFEEIDSISLHSLPLRNFFRKADGQGGR